MGELEQRRLGSQVVASSSQITIVSTSVRRQRDITTTGGLLLQSSGYISLVELLDAGQVGVTIGIVSRRRTRSLDHITVKTANRQNTTTAKRNLIPLQS